MRFKVYKDSVRVKHDDGIENQDKNRRHIQGTESIVDQVKVAFQNILANALMLDDWVKGQKKMQNK